MAEINYNPFSNPVVQPWNPYPTVPSGPGYTSPVITIPDPTIPITTVRPQARERPTPPLPVWNPPDAFRPQNAEDDTGDDTVRTGRKASRTPIGLDDDTGTDELSAFDKDWLAYIKKGTFGMLENLGFAKPEKYSKFIQEYDDYLEGRAEQVYGFEIGKIGEMESQYKDQRNLLYENYNRQLGSLFESMNAARSKSGFVSSGGLDRRQGIGAEMVRNEFGGKRGAINTQLDLLGVEREQAGFQRDTSIEDARRKYISDFYNKALQMLQSGAELEGSTRG